MIVVAFDPGETTGFCVFETKENEQAVPLKYDQVPFLELNTYLDTAPAPDVVIIEDFQLLPHKAQKLAGSRFETIQAIGVIKRYAHEHKAKVIVQSPTIKKIAERQTQVLPPRNHKQSHWVDAFNHGMYWMINNGLAKSQLELQGGTP